MLVTFDGYSPNDLDSVFFRQAAFSDTSDRLFLFTDTVHYRENGRYVGYGFKNMVLNTDRVFEIVIPSTGQVYKLSGLVKPDSVRYTACSPFATCTVGISEVTVTGGNYSIVRYSDYPYYLQLKK